MVDWSWLWKARGRFVAARRRVWPGVTAACLGWGAICSAQAPGSAWITTVGDVRALGADEAEKQARPVRLQGVGTWVSPSSLGLSGSERRRQVWVFAGVFGGGLALAAAWIATLHRSLRHQRRAEAALQALNSDLERRVEERTEALKEAQEEIRKALDQERELGALKSRFVTMVSHEFRTPLGIIMSAVELIRHYEERLPEEQRRELQDDIQSAAKQMGELMEQVLVLGRVEAGRLGCRAAPVDLGGLMGRIVDEVVAATQGRCPVRWIAESDLSTANADEGLVRHIFGNLIANAVKYSPAGSEVVVGARRDASDVVIQVKDAGIGIPEEDVPHLFEAFHRCGNVGEIPGTGLGLVIVKRCVEIHGGSLQLDSQVGKGTTFTVRLPVF